jgi:hypothetical protein
MNYLSGEKKLQTSWKLTTKALPRAAKKPGLYRNKMYPFCLPLKHAEYNLFQGIREDAIETFKRHNIIWHSRALPGLPTNHLCSSQVFAVNLLFPFINNPEALAKALRPHFPNIERMLPVEDKRYIAFEWIGKKNYLKEEPKIGGYRQRGAGNTSIDAMMMYETAEKEKVMLLIEIKYSESYTVSYKRFRSDCSDRTDTYKDFFYDTSSPVNRNIAPNLEDFLYEPFFQLLRHTLLASQIKKAEAAKLSHVQVVHLVVSQNNDLLIVTSPQFRNLGKTTYEVWRKLLKEPEGLSMIAVETFFKDIELAGFHELEPWVLYMKERYSFLR